MSGLLLGLWRYWIFPYRGDAATNIAVWRLIARLPPPPPPPPSKKNWCGCTCASAWSAAPKRLRAAEPQRIVAGVRFHWSCEEMYFQSERFVGRATLTASARARRCMQQTERNGGFGFQTKVKDCFLNQRKWQIILMKKNGLNVEHFRYHIAILINACWLTFIIMLY